MITEPDDPLDNTIRIVTPENIAFEYRLAGPFRRAVAYLLDLIIRILIVVFLGIVITTTLWAEASAGIFLVAIFVMEWGYGSLFEALWNGQTPAKRALGIRVVSTDGLPITAQQAFLRNLLRVADCFFYLLVGAVSTLVSRRFQRLGDVAANTMVVLEEKVHSARRYNVPDVPEEIDALIPASFTIDDKLAEAIATYVSRRSILSAPRRHQLAGLLVSALRTRFELPLNLNDDLVVCSLYRRFY